MIKLPDDRLAGGGNAPPDVYRGGVASGTRPGPGREAGLGGCGPWPDAKEEPMNSPGNLTYGGYLQLDELLSCQSPISDVHDEMLFVVIHQVYELWFKQILHETGLLQHRLETGDGPGALATGRRIAKILKLAIAQMDVLETLTPPQVARFRPGLGVPSGFQADQSRPIEAAFGRRHCGKTGGDPVREEIMGRRSVFESLLCYLNIDGWAVSAAATDRGPPARRPTAA